MSNRIMESVLILFFVFSGIEGGYVDYNYSYKSEKQAFDRAISILREMNIDIKRVRLDRYYSFKSIVNYFDKYSRFFLIPKNFDKRMFGHFIRQRLWSSSS